MRWSCIEFLAEISDKHVIILEKINNLGQNLNFGTFFWGAHFIRVRTKLGHFRYHQRIEIFEFCKKHLKVRELYSQNMQNLSP